MEVTEKFKIIYSEDVVAFLSQLNKKASAKIMYNINKCKYVLDKNLFKKLESSEIWEFRTLYNGTHYRIFAFWDTEMECLVVTTHAIIKKTQKTPTKEIEKAEAIRIEYFKQKRQAQNGKD